MKVYISAEDAHAEVSVSIDVKDPTRHSVVDALATGLDIPVNLIESRARMDERRATMEAMLRNGSRAALVALMGPEGEL